jgi:hypothetical protein
MVNQNKQIKNIPMKEIHDFVGQYLQKKLTGFIYSKTKKQVERKSKFKIDAISWDCAKYGETLHLSFCGLIRHNEIDSLYEKIFNIAKWKEPAIWDGFSELGDTEESTQYHIKSLEQMKVILEKVSSYFQEKIKTLFDCIVSDNDFLRYLYHGKRFDSYWNEHFALKRIMFCNSVDKSIIGEVHQYNLVCCQSAPSGDDFHVQEYQEGLRVLNNYTGGF